MHGQILTTVRIALHTTGETEYAFIFNHRYYWMRRARLQGIKTVNRRYTIAIF